MKTILETLRDAVARIRQTTEMKPVLGIVLGTGLGGLVEKIDIECDIDYSTIPGFVYSTVESHQGRLIFGQLSGMPVVAMQGRFHYYEGYTMSEITFPIRVMRELGADSLVISNAGGGMNLDYRKSDVVAITDHINLIGDNPLIGLNEPELGPRFPDMGKPYSPRLVGLAEKAAERTGVDLKKGVYVGVSGPSLETPAEYRFLRMIGADVVGMSTVPETIVAKQCGMEVLGLSIISDLCDPDNLESVSIEEIIAACNKAEPVMTGLICDIVASM